MDVKSTSKDKFDKLGYVAARRQLRKLRVNSKRLVDSLFAGNYRSVFKGPGLEFQEVRQYVFGDDVRFIDWNVSSRLQDTYCKIFNEEREVSLMFLLDISSSMTCGLNSSKIKLLQEVFALLGFAALNNGDKVGSVAFDEELKWYTPAKTGSQHFLGQLKNLLTASQNTTISGTDLANALKVTAETMKRRGICIILSDFKTDNYWAELSFLARRHEVIAIRLEDALDEVFPPIGYLAIKDAEEGQLTHFYPLSKKFQQNYQGYWETLSTTWKHNCNKRGIRTLSLRSSDDVSQCLLAFLRKRHY